AHKAGPPAHLLLAPLAGAMPSAAFSASSSQQALSSRTDRSCLKPGPSGRDLLNLSEFELDRRRASENGDGDLQSRPLLINLFHVTLERGERTIRDLDLLADLERDRRLRPLHTLLDLMQDAHRFVFGD